MFRNNLLKILNNKSVIILSIILFIMPFYYFQYAYNIGGDDTRLYFISPSLYYEYMTSTSWYSLGIVGSENSIYHILPMFYLLSFLELLGDYFFVNSAIYGILFSLSFLFMFLLIRQLKTDYYISILIAILYSLSPIIMFMYIQPLFSIFLVVYTPLIFYLLYISVVKDKLIYSILISFVNVLFLLSIFSFPYFFPILIYFVIVVILIFIFKPFDKSYMNVLFKNMAIILLLTVALSMFALMPYLHLLLSDSIFSDVSSSEIINSFKPTVAAVSQGLNILYPIEGLFHYSIQKNFNWQTLPIYDNYYNYLLVVNLLFVLFILVPMFYLKKISISEKKTYFILFISFIIQLFFFTVNIGIFKELFYWLGENVPFFQMFRNFFDKFRLIYLFSHILLLAYSLHLTYKYIYTKKLLIYLLFLLVIINIYPSVTGKYFNQIIWQSPDLKTKTVFDKEYLDYANSIKTIMAQDERVVSFPLNEAQYSVIESSKHDSAYVGVVLLNYLINRDEYGGFSSFRKHSALLKESLLNNDDDSIMKIFSLYGINYISIDTQFRYDHFQWPFDERIKSYFRNKKYDALLEHYQLTMSSSNGRFKLYKLKNKVDLFTIETKFIVGNKHDFIWESDEVLIDKSDSMESIKKLLNTSNGTVNDYRQTSNDRYTLSINSDNNLIFVCTKIPFDRDWVLLSNNNKIKTELIAVNNGFLGFLIDKRLNQLENNFELELYFSPRDIFEKYLFYSKVIMYILIGTIVVLVVKRRY